jgi:hypothetical protein
MFLKKRKAQSTAEYAIAFGLVIALAVGVLQVALKAGIRQKNKQAVDYLLSAGNDVTDFNETTGQAELLFSEDYRSSTIASNTYLNEEIMAKGGSVKSRQKQNIDTIAVSIEKIEGSAPTATP